MSDFPPITEGRVYLVGAGPGDPKLITVCGAGLLRRADAVLYDDLVHPGLLQHTRPDAVRIGLGRHDDGRTWTQAEVNERMVTLAREGKMVVRLKGGDPAVFARSADEIETLTRAGIAYEIVPGITAGLAAASLAGIPITHRDLASAVALVTGQESAERDEPGLDFAALANFPGTLVFYMGLASADEWTAALIRAGKPPETPAAIVSRCSLPDQRTVRCRLDEVAARLQSDPSAPAVVIVGAAAAQSETRAWFECRPLAGQRILVTRPVAQSTALSDQLAELGAEVLVQPAICISDPPDWRPVDAALDRLGAFDWLVFSSVNGVHYLLGRLLSRGGDLRVLGGVRLAAIGPGTADALGQYRLQVDLVPPEYRAESLAESLAGDATGRRFLLARASRGREVLAERLQAAGAHVEQVVVYTSTDCTTPAADIARDLAEGRIHWVIVTSSAIARALAAMFGASLRRARLASISPITSATLRELGFAPAIEAGEYTMPGVVRAIQAAPA